MFSLIGNVFFLFAFAQLFQPAFAADISKSQNGGFLLAGQIQKGDAEKLLKSILQAHGLSALSLDSPGGDVDESLHIALLVKALHSSTEVVSGGLCTSACFFIYLAGDRHVAAGTVNGEMPKLALGYIGLHRPYIKFDPTVTNALIDSEARQHAVMLRISAYLRNLDVPQRLIDLMMTRPSNDVYWMTYEDVEQLGEYSPGREELLISRCGYSRHMRNEWAKGKLLNDSAAITRGEAQSKAFIECSYDAFPDLIEEAVKNKELLRKGWRPWSTSISHRLK